jgi:hypothetical protein
VQTALEQGRERQIFDWMKQHPEGSTPVTRKEIKDCCTSQFQVPITLGSVNSFVLRDPDDIIQTKSAPKKNSVRKYCECFLNEQCRM